ncbi:MAG: hypothetical protein V4598_00340 [Bdellovibrionota bacterium]
MRTLLITILFLFTSCQGTRFYWETRYEVTQWDSQDQAKLNQEFKINQDMSAWHPVFGKYCSSLKSDRANLFVCFKNNEIRIVSSYSGILKGDKPIRKLPRTVKKYLTKIQDQPGFLEHREIEGYIEDRLKVKTKFVRLLMYGPGSTILKDELAQ